MEILEGVTVSYEQGILEAELVVPIHWIHGYLQLKNTHPLVCLQCRFASPTWGSLFRPSLRASCTGGLDSRDAVLRAERKQVFSVDPFYERARLGEILGEIKIFRRKDPLSPLCWAK